jgi:hypothetical protein
MVDPKTFANTFELDSLCAKIGNTAADIPAMI